MSEPALLTIGEVARRLGCDSWHVRRVYERGLMPPAQRVGRHRAVPLGDLPAMKKALLAAGYLR